MSSKELLEVLEKLPADDYETAQGLCEKLLAGGAETIGRLVEMVGDRFGDPDGAKPKYAVHGLVHYACRPGGAGARKLLAETLAGELSADHSDGQPLGALAPGGRVDYVALVFDPFRAFRRVGVVALSAEESAQNLANLGSHVIALPLPGISAFKAV